MNDGVQNDSELYDILVQAKWGRHPRFHNCMLPMQYGVGNGFIHKWISRDDDVRSELEKMKTNAEIMWSDHELVCLKHYFFEQFGWFLLVYTKEVPKK